MLSVLTSPRKAGTAACAQSASASANSSWRREASRMRCQTQSSPDAPGSVTSAPASPLKFDACAEASPRSSGCVLKPNVLAAGSCNTPVFAAPAAVAMDDGIAAAPAIAPAAAACITAAAAGEVPTWPEGSIGSETLPTLLPLLLAAEALWCATASCKH
jgi:hypothetical protein